MTFDEYIAEIRRRAEAAASTPLIVRARALQEASALAESVTVPDDLSEDLALMRAERDALFDAIQRPRRCYVCDAPATCVGRYEGHGPVQYGCDEHCGHGNEDGWCVEIAVDVLPAAHGSVTAPTWRDVTPEHPAVGEPVIIMLRGMFAIVERKADGEWWTDWSAGHQRIHSYGPVATRYLPIPADEVPRG